MRCSKPGCEGIMYRFLPKHLVTACYHADTEVLLEVDKSQWKQVGLVCDTCGCLEFYASNPQALLEENAEYFEATEPASGAT